MYFNSDRNIRLLHKKTEYIFPEKTNIFLRGDKLTVEINNKKIVDLSDYAADSPTRSGPYKISLPITGRGSQLYKEYQTIADYLYIRRRLDFLQLEHAAAHDFALCTFFRPDDAAETDAFVKQVKKELPHLINIFRRPLIHLKEADVVQSIDSVKRINHNTIKHLSTHAENWKDIKDGEVFPSKLLTKVYDDDYGIYENLVFRDLIDSLLLFLRKKIFYLSEVISTFNDCIQLDAINKLNHSQYYLAIGKLYIGFAETENSSEVSAMLENLKSLYKQLKQYTPHAVYSKNSHHKATGGKLKKTNILSMHKDYKHVYALYQKYLKKDAAAHEAGNPALQNQSQRNYELFCQMLTLFAISHFSFRCKNSQAVFENLDINAEFDFKDWSVKTCSAHNPLLGIKTIEVIVSCGDALQKYLLIPTSYFLAADKKAQYEYIVKNLYLGGYVCDKYVFLEPFDFYNNAEYNYSVKTSCAATDLFFAVLPVSVSEINSFRRLQKILFEGMVLTDEYSGTCAFCGEPTYAEHDRKVCRKCRTAVADISCAHCKKIFKASFVDVGGKAQKAARFSEYSSDDLPDFYRYEKETLFRNITDMNEDGYICPYCGIGNKI